MANPFSHRPEREDQETGIVGYIVRSHDRLMLPLCLIAGFLTIIEWIGWI
jgi:hypothetical protein